MKYGIAVVALLLTATPVHAQDAAPAFFLSTAAADWTMTYAAVTRHPLITEDNKSINWLAPHPAAMVGLGAAEDVATYLIVRKMGVNHPKLARGVFYAMGAFRVYLTARSIRNIATVVDAPVYGGAFHNTAN
jgi:hypothetical protein